MSRSFKYLDGQDIKALGYHAGMEEEERSRIQEAFLEGRADLIVATNAFGMGIDRSDIRLIIHYQLPGTMEAYYQECGRAGRDGDPATCLLLFSPSDRKLQEFFIEMSYPAREVVLAVYQALLQRPEDPLWMTHREIGHLCDPPVKEMAVASSLKILEEAGVVHRLHRYENLAEFYLKRRPGEILQVHSQEIGCQSDASSRPSASIIPTKNSLKGSSSFRMKSSRKPASPRRASGD